VKIVCITIRTKRELKKEVVAPAGLQPLACYTETLKSGNFRGHKKRRTKTFSKIKKEGEAKASPSI
jgi:hypothetical protein